MSYQVLARKWRPRSFDTLVGQEHVVRALTHALSEGRLHHAYLFTGTRGVGKTTLARILAKALNCEKGVSAAPCGECSSCREIDAGRFVDLLEVDAATNTKVDEMRQLLENAVYAPTRGRFKVYVIDEVHMLSTSAFNAMLKTLEEPPDHVKFILATTDPQKIPVTVLSRCMQFNLKQMPPASISGHLVRILDAEAIRYETGALALLARSAAGSMRDALSLLDQAIAYGAGAVEEATVRDMLGSVDADHLYGILEALSAGDCDGMLRVAAQMEARSLSLDLALQELAVLLTRVQVAQLAPGSLDPELPERDRLLGVAAALDPEFVQLSYQIVVHGRRDLALAPDEAAGFVMTLLRLAAFRPDEVPELRRERRPPTLATVSSASSEGRTARTQQMPASESRGGALSPPSDDAVHALPAVAEASGESIGDWHAVVPRLRLSGMARELAQHCELRQQDGAQIVLRLPPLHRHLQMKPAQEKLQQALSDYCGRAMALRIELAEVEGATPAATMQQERRERQERAVAAIETDGFVRDAIELFDARLIEDSIKPI